MIDSSAWGRFTVYGSAILEENIAQMALTIAQTFQPFYVQGEVRALILLGGYGRGEGGVVVGSQQDRPHNNFDLLLVTSGSDYMKEQSELILTKLQSKLGFDLDMSLTTEAKLQNLAPRIIWYDMLQQHKILLGAKDYMKRFKGVSLKEIPTWDFRNLLINRGTLFIINELLIKECEVTQALRHTLIKHIIKGIIGYGDALLYFHGKYHWSYVQKLTNMRDLAQVDLAFRNLYQEAAEFRLRSDYTQFAERDLDVWVHELQPILANVFLEVEQKRLGNTFSWDEYLDFFYEFEFYESKGLREWLKKIRNIVKSPLQTTNLDRKFLIRLSVKAGGVASLTAALFPLVAFDLSSQHYRDFAANFIDLSDAPRGYLRFWSNAADPSLAKNLQKNYGISLEGKQ